MITIEETLMAANLAADIKPHVIWRELLLGVAKRKVFLGLVLETDVLVGHSGTKVSVPIFTTGYTASTITETSLDTSGFTVTNPAITDVDVNIDDMVYVAFRLSSILGEDSPDYNYVKSCLAKALDAVLDNVDANIRDALLAGAGNTRNAANDGTLAYADIVNLKNQMEADSWFAEDGEPTVVIYPDQQVDLLTSTTFTETIRWSQGSIPFDGDLGGPMVPLFAGCKILVSDGMIPALALMVMPQGHRFGPNTIFAWKRRYTVERDREVLNGRDLFTCTVRFGCDVIQANAVGLISAC